MDLFPLAHRAGPTRLHQPWSARLRGHSNCKVHLAVLVSPAARILEREAHAREMQALEERLKAEVEKMKRIGNTLLHSAHQHVNLLSPHDPQHTRA